MVCSITSPILHPPPLAPRSWGSINLDIPYPLSPNYILHPQARMVIHRPLSNSLTNRIPIWHHEIEGESETVVTGLVGIAPDSVDFAGELAEDAVSGGDDVGLAVGGGDGWVAGAAGEAAFEVGGARAET